MACYYYQKISIIALIFLILDSSFGLHCYDYRGGDVYCSDMCCYDPDKGDDLTCCDGDTYDVRSKAAFSLTFVFIAVFIVMVVLAFVGLKTKRTGQNCMVSPGYGNPTVVAYRNGSQQVGYPQHMAVNQSQPVFQPPVYPGYA